MLLREIACAYSGVGKLWEDDFQLAAFFSREYTHDAARDLDLVETCNTA